MKLPASYSFDQIPTDAVSEFLFQGKAGQYLRVEVQEEEHNNGGLLSKLTAEALPGAQDLASLNPAYCRDEQIYQLPHDGNFRVLFDAASYRSALHFSSIEKDDPLVDVGLKPEQVSINFGTFGIPGPPEVHPYDHPCEIGESWPASIVIHTNKLWFYVTQVEGYKKMFPDGGMESLISRLRPGSKLPDAKSLPYANWDGGTATVMTARQQRIEGEGWKGWRWIEGFSQDGDYPADIAYIFEGLTNDGRFFLRFRATIAQPEVTRLSPNSNQSNKERGKQETSNRPLLEMALAAADPASFAPNLNELDAAVRSLNISH